MAQKKSKGKKKSTQNRKSARGAGASRARSVPTKRPKTKPFPTGSEGGPFQCMKEGGSKGPQFTTHEQAREWCEANGIHADYHSTS
tara:strand:- start:1284 stop:1541 length:258 start_codon:yes stop_codon:yes gene_type:complete